MRLQKLQLLWSLLIQATISSSIEIASENTILRTNSERRATTRNVDGVCTEPFLKVPFDAGPFACKDAEDYTEEHHGNCGNGPIDAKYTSDSECLSRGAECHVGWTEEGENLYYQFSSDYTGLVDLTFRVASKKPQAFRVILSMNLGDFFEETFETPGKGWGEFEDVVWKNVDFRDSVGDRNFLTIFFGKNMNFCAVSIHPSRPGDNNEVLGVCNDPFLEVPFDASPFACKDAKDFTEEHRGNCGSGPIDAKYTSDSVCLARGAECHVGWTEQGENLFYQFSSDYTGPVDVTFRVASKKPQVFRVILSMNLGDFFEETFETPGKGWDEFEDVVWKNVDFRDSIGDRNFLTIFFGKNMNFCAVSIQPSNPAACSDPFLEVPFDAGAFDCLSAYDTTEEHFGNCGSGPIDSSFTSDSVCLTRGGECHIESTEAGEYVEYQFASDEGYAGMMDVTFRVASLEAGNFRVRLDLNLGDLFEESFTTPGNGLESYEDVVWKNVDFRDSEGERNFLTIFFHTGMNFCSLSITPASSS